MPRKTIRILFANCPNLDESACAYLILAQNKVQPVFEFEVFHLSVWAEQSRIGNWWTHLLKRWGRSVVWLLPWRKTIEKRFRAGIDCLAMPPLSTELPLDTALELLRPYVQQHDSWVNGLGLGYGGWAIRPGPMIIVTETGLGHGYLSIAAKDLAVVSLRDWGKKHRPPSVIEYATAQIQRLALRMAISERIGSHYPTRACMWDFTADERDARMGILTGYLCETCRTLALERMSEPDLKHLEEVLSHRWIGRIDEPGTVASNLKRVFGYDLARTRGLSPSFLERMREHAPGQIVSLLGTGIAALIGALATLLTLWLQHKLSK